MKTMANSVQAEALRMAKERRNADEAQKEVLANSKLQLDLVEQVRCNSRAVVPVEP